MGFVSNNWDSCLYMTVLLSGVIFVVITVQPYRLDNVFIFVNERSTIAFLSNSWASCLYMAVQCLCVTLTGS